MAPSAVPHVWIPAAADVPMFAVNDAGCPPDNGVNWNVHWELPVAFVGVGVPSRKIWPFETHWTAGEGEVAGAWLWLSEQRGWPCICVSADNEPETALAAKVAIPEPPDTTVSDARASFAISSDTGTGTPQIRVLTNA